jgi:hypothetical protein
VKKQDVQSTYVESSKLPSICMPFMETNRSLAAARAFTPQEKQRSSTTASQQPFGASAEPKEPMRRPQRPRSPPDFHKIADDALPCRVSHPSQQYHVPDISRNVSASKGSQKVYEPLPASPVIPAGCEPWWTCRNEMESPAAAVSGCPGDSLEVSASSAGSQTNFGAEGLAYGASKIAGTHLEKLRSTVEGQIATCTNWEAGVVNSETYEDGSWAKVAAAAAAASAAVAVVARGYHVSKDLSQERSDICRASPTRVDDPQPVTSESCLGLEAATTSAVVKGRSVHDCPEKSTTSRIFEAGSADFLETARGDMTPRDKPEKANFKEVMKFIDVALSSPCDNYRKMLEASPTLGDNGIGGTIDLLPGSGLVDSTNVTRGYTPVRGDLVASETLEQELQDHKAVKPVPVLEDGSSTEKGHDLQNFKQKMEMLNHAIMCGSDSLECEGDHQQKSNEHDLNQALLENISTSSSEHQKSMHNPGGESVSLSKSMCRISQGPDGGVDTDPLILRVRASGDPLPEKFQEPMAGCGSFQGHSAGSSPFKQHDLTLCSIVDGARAFSAEAEEFRTIVGRCVEDLSATPGAVRHSDILKHLQERRKQECL